MTATLDDEGADLRPANAELQRRLDEALTERDEALEQQTATAEVLGVINSSPGDLAPVFDAMLEKAMRLCEASFGHLQTYDGDMMRPAAIYSAAPEYREALWKGGPYRPTPGNSPAISRLLAGEQYVHVSDLTATEDYQSGAEGRRWLTDVAGARTALWMALRKDDAVLGVFTIYRREVRPFTDKQIALLQNFAAQAVIAMENARLITETREALEQQTATAEVLQVINSSPGDLAPVFEAIVGTAARICSADTAAVMRLRDGQFHLASAFGVSQEWRDFVRQNPAAPGRGTVTARVALEGRVVHVEDILNDPDYTLPQAQQLGAFRTALGVPLLHDGQVIGVIALGRLRVEPFSEHQIDLVHTFAQQAVIAMENARLITETREALDQQTATAEVLQVINSSPGDLAPVFDAMLDKATRLCEAECGLLGTYEDDHGFRGVATVGFPMEMAEALSRIGHPPSGTALGRLERTKQTVQLADTSLEPAYAEVFPRNPWLRSVRTNLVVPMLREGELVGAFNIFREVVRPFTDNQIALLENFAAQAVIAMENARLLSEIRQRQAELRVTFDNMADGVVMFDEDLRLAAWNRNFQELLDLPDAVLAERPSYANYLRILAERGEFGTDDIEAELGRRLEHTDQELRVERTRPNGQIIEVRRNSVPDGGFVLIYSDITERRRSEAEIRAARDAAEATLRDLRAAQSSLIQAQKMAALGQLTAGIAHEIKNPLNFVNNFADLSAELLKELKESAAPGWIALDEDKRAEIDETIVMLTSNLEKISEHGRRADGIVKSMLEHSRGVTSERRVVDLNNLIEEALNLAYHGARAQDQTFNIRMDREFDRDLARIELLPQEMSRVFINLFGNGFYAATKRQRESGEAEFEPTLTVATRDLGEAVEVRVRDNGTGIPGEIRDKLFQPFFTTKPTGEGTGLGLSISYDIVTQQHGGTIEVASRVGEFTEFTIRLPRTQAVSTGAAA